MKQLFRRPTVLSFFLLSYSFVVAAQRDSPTAACGSDAVQFSVSLDSGHADVSEPAPGKAGLYILEVSDVHDKHRFGRPTIRQGVDGAWAGATQGFSYIRLDVNPGPHHLCSRWQSHFARLTDELSLNNFTADAGRTYFFRVQITTQGSAGDTAGPSILDLQPISDDEGRFLVNQASQSKSTIK